MHISSCRHPKIIHNPYLDEDVAVPCGECDVCLTNRALQWVKRLEIERQDSAYTIFFTLTYAEEYLPLLVLESPADKYCPAIYSHKKRDFTNLIVKKKYSDEFNDYQVPVYDTVLSEQSTKNIMRLHANAIPYCSVYDCENFIKRLRSRCYRKVYGTVKGLSEEQKMRYFISSEYGPTTLRPHYHGLLFVESEKLASTITECLSEVWSFGRVDVQYVSSSAPAYVAAYLNSICNLPRVYKSTLLRPFSISSKRTPIGLRSYEDKETRELFYSSSPLIPVNDEAAGEVSYIPLWRSLEDRLYPKLPHYSTLDPDDRLKLLGLFTRQSQDSLDAFKTDVINLYKHFSLRNESNYFTKYLEDLVPQISVFNIYKHSVYGYGYIERLFDKFNVIRRLFYVVRRVSVLCFRFNCSVCAFVSISDRYRSNKELYLLQEQYRFQETFSMDCESVFLLGSYPVFFSRIRSLSWDKVTPTLLLQLEGFGLSFSRIKEIYSDEKIKRSYFRKIHVSRTMDYQDMMSVRHKIISDTRKTKRKNEYLEKHPELKDLY